MKTYVVNMEKDTQKRELIISQLKQHTELDWQIWMGVEGNKLSADEQKKKISSKFFEKYKTNATLPAAGCSLSHYYIYKDMTASGTAYALVLEDDAILSENMHLDKLSKYLRTDYPVVVLLSPEFWYWEKNKKEDLDEKHTLYQISNGLMTSGYLINLAAARMLECVVFPVKYLADSWTDFVKMGLTLYGIVPHLTSYPEGIGEIGRSQQKRSLYIRLRMPLVRVYLAYLRWRRSMTGEKHSKRLW